MSLFTINGSGFGLYGYLPALVSCGQRVALPQRYYDRFYNRLELLPFADRVQWQVNDDELLTQCAGVVLALNPELQLLSLPMYLKQANINYLILEKPLAPSPQQAVILFDRLLESKKKFHIGYNFRYTEWGKYLLSSLKAATSTNKIFIRWNFMAHHFSQNVSTWKRFHRSGGGIIRFYGIHLIALLAEIGYSRVIHSQTVSFFEDEYEKWQLVVGGDDLPDCEVTLDSRSLDTKFQISEISPENIVVDIDNPFAQVVCADAKIDSRVFILKQLCQSLLSSNSNHEKWYAESIELWHRIENLTLWNEKVGTF